MIHGEELISGIVIGFLARPFMDVAKTIFTNAWKAYQEDKNRR